MERAATRTRCPVASEVSEVSAMRIIGQLQGQRARRPYAILLAVNNLVLLFSWQPIT